MPTTKMFLFKSLYFYILICVIICFLNLEKVSSAEPITTGIAVGAAITFSALLASYDVVKCSIYECCDKTWLSPNITALQDRLDSELHGQHLVRDVVVRTLKGHAFNSDPSKSLVLSFHGWTGGGKNFVSRLIVNSLFKKGFESQYVHLFVAPLHFPHVSKIETYKDQLREWIKGNVSLCPRSMFIFDEMDKMPDGLLDVIKPFLDHYPEINGVDYRKSTFVFLSNTAGTAINERALQHWHSGKKREDMTYKEMEELIILSAYNEKGGLWHSALIQSNLISAFVPFLPLERSHIKKCVADELRRKGHYETEAMKDSVADELHYFPADTKLFSKSGCKKVSEKVDLLYEEL